MVRITPLTLGWVVRRISVGGFDVIESRYPPHHSQPFHEHDRPVFVYVLDGRVFVTATGGDLECPATSLRLIPAGQRHRARYGVAATRCLVVGVGDERASSLRLASQVLDEPAYHPPRAPVNSYAAQVQRELERNDTLSPLAIEGMLLELLIAASRRKSTELGLHPPAWLNRVRERLHGCFQASFRLTELAADAQVHPVHLSRSFRRYFGCNIAAYARRLRLDWAKAALLENQHSIGRIALEAGFADQSDFSRRFRIEVGVTPSQFRAGRASASTPVVRGFEDVEP